VLTFFLLNEIRVLIMMMPLHHIRYKRHGTKESRNITYKMNVAS